jgi:hypothetical protein
MSTAERRYCLLMDGSKRNRNAGCKRHDNAYGIHGGGNGADRLAADLALLLHMRSNHDPLAGLAYLFTRCFGWIFFNYHAGLWRGQLVRKLWPAP